MLEIAVLDSLAGVDRAEWNALFPSEIEDYDYLTAVERSAMPGFRWRYLTARENGKLVGAAPAFHTTYALETTLQGPLRDFAGKLRRAAPALLDLRLACIGSPVTETAGIACRADRGGSKMRIQIIFSMLDAFEADAAQAGCALLAVKDAPKRFDGVCDSALRALDYLGIAGQPIANLEITGSTLDAYLSDLSPGTRRDMRRKLRSLEQVRVEITTDISGVLDRVMALYNETRSRAEMTFETLTPDFFTGVVKHMPERAFFVLYYLGDELLAANLLLQQDGLLLDKFFCMEAERGRSLNLYFLSWFTNVQLCIERGCSRYQSGQAAYENKVRLGSRLSPTVNYFKHRNSVVDMGLRLMAPIFAAHPTGRAA